MSTVFKTMKSPVGELTLIADEKHLLAILWEKDRPNRVRAKATEKSRGNPVIHETQRQLTEYFCGERKKFDLPLKFMGTGFQQKVWRELQRIPYGKTLSYSDIAQKIGSPKSCRAVGAANGRNPVSIVCPCHRVIGKGGSLTGFAGGLETKKYLLELEGRARQESR